MLIFLFKNEKKRRCFLHLRSTDVFLCATCVYRVVDLIEVMSSCAINVCDVDNDNSSESADVVSTELVSPPHQVRPMARFTKYIS